MNSSLLERPRHGRCQDWATGRGCKQRVTGIAKMGHGPYMEYFFYALISLHILAALWHQYVRKDGAIDRIVPWGKTAAVS